MDTWWTYLRWSFGIRLMRIAERIMPDGEAKRYLHGLHMQWANECRRQWSMRYAKTKH